MKWEGNTSAAPADHDRWSAEDYKRALAAAKALGPIPGEVTFCEAAGGVAVMVGDQPLCWLSRDEFEALRRRIGGSDGR
jgi:hypothetical protein